jgi:hypothetical protein
MPSRRDHQLACSRFAERKMFVPLYNKPRRLQSIVGQTQAEHESLLSTRVQVPLLHELADVVCALIYLAEHKLGLLRFSLKNPSLLFALF